jgi:peroxiredoxin
MSEQKKQTALRPAVLLAGLILAAIVVWRLAIYKPASHIHTGNELLSESLNKIISSARTWGPTNRSWFGKMAPDFTLTDITGKQHKLSDYRGKNVMLVFWATWCGPCLMEMPHLIALRNIIGEDKLAMLAVSFITTYPPNSTEAVKKLVEKEKINYTVFSVDVADMPAPYNQIQAIPCSFFIDPQGKIKLATEGLLTLGDFKAIIQAE